MKQASVHQLFSQFDTATQATLAHPRLLDLVHGLGEISGMPQGISEDEKRAIAYLSHLLDAFQLFWSVEYRDNYSLMVLEYRANRTFLNRLLQVPANQARWEIVKNLYYGEGLRDRKFIAAIDELVQYEQSRQTTKA